MAYITENEAREDERRLEKVTSASPSVCFECGQSPCAFGCGQSDSTFPLEHKPLRSLSEAASDDDSGCQQLIDGPGCAPCGKPVTHIVAEPFTPAAFKIECCADCARDFIYQGYFSICTGYGAPENGFTCGKQKDATAPWCDRCQESADLDARAGENDPSLVYPHLLD